MVARAKTYPLIKAVVAGVTTDKELILRERMVYQMIIRPVTEY
jgi:hypothetical protein